MTTPAWLPPPNPGGQYRWQVTEIMHDWLASAHILGVDRIHLEEPALIFFGAALERTGTGNYTCHLMLRQPRRTRARLATEHDGPGGVQYTAEFEIRVFHRSYDVDPYDLVPSAKDYARIIDAVIDQLAARGRDLGRPDVILVAGEYPRDSGIVDEHDPPVVDGSSVDRWGMISLSVIFVPPSPQEEPAP